jgi:hypothetical protein
MLRKSIISIIKDLHFFKVRREDTGLLKEEKKGN